MNTFTAHERTGDDADLLDRAERILFVKEGIAWWAILFPVLWLLWHRMWLVLGLFVGLLVVLQAGISAIGLPEQVAAGVTFAMSALLAFQGNDLKRWTLARRGYETAGLVSGRDQEEAELRFFDEWLDGQPAMPAAAQQETSPPKRETSASRTQKAASDDDVIGLFPGAGQ